MADGGLHFAGYSVITLATTFAHPTDMTITPDGRLFVADTDNARLVELNLTTGAVVLDFPGPDGNAFSGPRALYADDELLYVRDGERVVELAINDYWSGPFADDALATPIRLAARADELLVLDATRVVRVDAVGNAQGAFGEALQPATFNPPTRITVAAGSYYVLDGENGRIISYTATGARQHVVDGLAIPSGLATNGTDRIAATSTAAHQVRLYDLDLNPVTFVGSLGSGNDQFNDPTGIAWTGTGWVVVDGGNARLIHLSAPGGYVSQHPISAGGREVARWTGHSVVLYSDHFTVYDDAGTVMSASGVDFYDARGLATDGVDLFVYADAVVLHYQWDAVTETWGVYNVFYPADEGTGLWVDATHIVIGEHTTDGAGRVVVADRDFIEELTWGVAGTDGRDLSAPVALAVDADEIAWVADSDEDLIKRYDLAENFLDPVALAGVVDLAASADGTTIYAVTVGGDLVTYVAATQAVTATVALGVTPTRMVVAGDGRLWIGAEGGTVGVYSAAGVLETSYSTTDTIIGAAPGDGVYTVSGTTLTRRSSTFALVITHALGAHAPVDSLHWGGAWWLTDTSSLTTLIPAWEAVRTWWKEGSPGTDPHQPFIEGVVAPVGTSAVAPDNLTMGLYDPTRDFLYSVAGPMRPTGIVAAQEDTGQYVPAVWVADASRCQVHAYSYRPTRPSTYLGAVQDPVFGHTLQAFDDEDGGVYTNTRERTDFPWTRSVRVIAEGAQGHPAIDSSGRYHVSVFDDDFVLRRFVSTDGGRTWAEEA
jgi:hypothetical protein